MMNSEAVLTCLRRHQNELQNRGILHAAVFGSVARGDTNESNDIDILIEINPEISMDIYAYSSLKRYVADLFPISTDVVNQAALKQGVSVQAQKEAVYAF